MQRLDYQVVCCDCPSVPVSAPATTWHPDHAAAAGAHMNAALWAVEERGESSPGLPALHCRGFAGGERLHSVYIIEARRTRWGPLGGGVWRVVGRGGEGGSDVDSAALGRLRLLVLSPRRSEGSGWRSLFTCIIHWLLRTKSQLKSRMSRNEL